MTDEAQAAPSALAPKEGPRTRAVVAGVITALVSLALALLGDRVYFANGVSVAWQHEHEGATEVIAETVEHDISFPNRHRALARYVANWRVADHGLPRIIPPLDAVVRARFLVPPGPARGIGCRTGDAVSITIDGRAIDDETRIPPGWHALAAHWTGRLSDRTSFELTWENGEPVPRDLLFVPGGWPASRSLFWLLSVLAALFLGGLVVRAELSSSPTRTARYLGLATLLVVRWGTGLRAYEYELEPEPLENYDEYFALWNGWSILEDGTSRGWSAWPSVYGTTSADAERFTFWGTPLTVVSPYFENPPLMHLLVGAVSHLSGATDYRDAHVADGRLVSLALSALTIWLIILVARRLAPSGPGPWLAGVLWAAIPTLVLQTRVIKEELLVVPLALGTILFFLRWRDDGRRDRDLYLAALCAGLGVVAKIPAAIFVPGLVMLFVSAGDARAGRRTVGIALATGGALLFGFAAYHGVDVFLAASGAQTGGRALSFNLFPRFLDVFQVNGWFMGRGWLLFLWVAALGTLYTWSPQRRAVIAVPLALYFTAIGVGTGNNTLGWYALPVVAYLVIGAGIFLGDLYREPDLLRGVLFGLLFFSYTLNFLTPPSTLVSPDPAGQVRVAVMITVVLLTAPYCLVQVWPRLRPLARGTFVLSMAVCLAVSASVILRWEDIGPTYRNMDREITFFP